MANTYTAPVISVAFDMDEGQYQLMATSLGRSAIAGERIFRAEPWPVIKFKHEDEGAAHRDAATLRAYLEEYSTGKTVEGAPRAKGYWED